MVAPAAPGLEWSAPAQCPDAAVMRGWVEAYTAAGTETAVVPARGRIEASAGGFVLELEVDDGSGAGARRLEHEDCEALARAAALIVAVAADPVAVAQRVRVQEVGVVPDLVAPVPTPDEAIRTSPEPQAPDPAPAPPQPEDPPAQTQREPPPPDRPERPDRPRLRPGTRTREGGVRMGLRPEVGVGLGVLPGVAGVGVGGVVALLGRAAWRVEAGGHYWPTRTAVTEPGADQAGGRLRMGTGAVRGCWSPSLRRIELPVCGGLELGGVVGRGFGDGIASQRQVELWLGVPVGLGVAWAPLRWLAIGGRIEAVIGLRRPGFHLDGVGEVYRAGAVGARATFGVEVRFF